MTGRARLPMDLSLAQGANPRRWMPTLAAGLSIGEYARSLVRRLAFLSAVLLAAIWALGGQGYFWPAWAWLGLGVLVLIDFGASWAWRREAGAIRRVACVWSVVGVAAVILVFTWLLTWLLAGARSFWPAWALLGLATSGSAYSLIALHDRVLVARGRRALRARIDMLTRTRRQAVDAQAAELRRIERDLHDGAQARLVALTLQLGRAEVRVARPARGSGADPRRPARGPSRDRRAARPRARASCRRCSPTAGWSPRCESLAARYGLGTAIEADTHRGLAPAVESAAYFVIAEALTNTAKHARAQHSWVRLRDEHRSLAVARRRRRLRRRRPAGVGARRAARQGGGARRQPERAQLRRARGRCSR